MDASETLESIQKNRWSAILLRTSGLLEFGMEGPAPDVRISSAFLTPVVLTLITVGACSGPVPDAPGPELVLTNGKIITMADSNLVTEAVAIRGDKVFAVGTATEIQKLADSSTQIIDLNGRAVTPGFIDVHNHFAWGALGEVSSLNLAYPNVGSIQDIVSLVEAEVAQAEPGAWIVGGNWDAGKLAEGRGMRAADLDPVSENNPVWLTHTSAHYGVANSAALKLANITSDSRDPDGGVIERDENGRPTGILADKAMALIFAVTPETTVDDFDEAITREIGSLNAVGITTIKDPEIDQRHWDAYARLRSRGELTVRVFTLWGRPNSMEEAEELLEHIAPFTDPVNDTGDDHLISGGVKIYIDGSGTARTAWMHDDWNVNFSEFDDGNTGLTYLEPEVLMQQIRLFHNAGIHMGIHSIGDRAIDFTMDAYDTVLKEDPISGLRHSIIHSNLPTEHALDLMVKLQTEFDTGYPEIQPAFLWWIGDAYAGNFGPERSKRVLPMKTFLERGIRWGGSSDYDVSPYAPGYALWAAADRETMNATYGNNHWGKDESIGVMDSIRAYTRWSARQVFLEDKIGSIEAGKYADIVVWDRDPLAVPTGELKELKAVLTLMNGNAVHGDLSSPIWKGAL